MDKRVSWAQSASGPHSRCTGSKPSGKSLLWLHSIVLDVFPALRIKKILTKPQIKTNSLRCKATENTENFVRNRKWKLKKSYFLEIAPSYFITSNICSWYYKLNADLLPFTIRNYALSLYLLWSWYSVTKYPVTQSTKSMKFHMSAIWNVAGDLVKWTHSIVYAHWLYYNITGQCVTN